MVAASNYTVGIEFDTTPAQRAVEDMRRFVERMNRAVDELQRGLRQTEGAAKSNVAPLEKAGKAADDMGKRFGLASGKLKDFSRFGVTVFTGDIIAKVLGFGSALGAVSAASGIAADAIRGFGVALYESANRDAVRAQAEFKKTEDAMERLRLKAEQIRSEQLQNTGAVNVGGKSVPVSLGGLQGSFFLSALDELRRVQSQIDNLYGKNGRVPLNDKEADFAQFRREVAQRNGGAGGILKEFQGYIAQQEKAQQNEERRLELLRRQTTELQRQLELSKYLGNGQPVTGSGGFGNALGIGGLASRGAAGLYGLAFDQRNQAAAQAFAAANQSAQFDEYRRRNFGGGGQYQYPEAYGTGTFGAAGGALAGALTRGGGVAFDVVQRAVEGQRALEAFNREQVRLAQAANNMGFAFAGAFESFILGAQSAQDAVRQLGLQIIQSLLNVAVTQPIQQWFQQFAFGAIGGVGSAAQAGSAAGVPSGISSPLPGGGNFRGGASVPSGMNYSARQSIDRTRSVYS